MPVNPDIIFILLYFQKKVYRQSVPSPIGEGFLLQKSMRLVSPRKMHTIYSIKE